MAQRLTSSRAIQVETGRGATAKSEQGRGRSVLPRLIYYLGPFRLQLFFALLLVIVSAGVQALGPALIGRAIDVYITRKDSAGLAQIMLLLISVYVVGLVAQGGQIYVIGRVGQSFLARLRALVFDKVQTLSLSFFDQNRAGDLMSRLVNDIQAINQLLSQGLTQVIGSLFSLVGILVAMIVLSPLLALVSFLVIPLMIWITLLFGRRSGVAFQRTRVALGDVSSELEEELSGIRVAQAYNRAQRNIERFAAQNAVNRDANVQAVRITSAFTPTIDVISTLATVVVAAFGGWLAINNQLAVGVVVAFFLYVQQFFRPIQLISNIYTPLQNAEAGARRIFDLLDEPTRQQDRDIPGAQPLPPIVGRVVYDHVNFAYDTNADPPALVLHDLNLTVEPGETIALVGETGAGKSTFVNLLPRFYEVTSGSILIDGHDIHDVTLASLRSQIGIVQQDTFLFSGTVADNIRYGRLDATDAEVEEAAKTVSIHDFIMSLPQGYQTKLGERGVGLSQGQRQLLAFARTVLANTPLLILDEATSNIDTRTEELIQQALASLLTGRTAFIIAHRLSTVRNANRVIVIDAGRIVESGTHAELLAKGGRYAELYNRQFP